MFTDVNEFFVLFGYLILSEPSISMLVNIIL